VREAVAKASALLLETISTVPIARCCFGVRSGPVLTPRSMRALSSHHLGGSSSEPFPPWQHWSGVRPSHPPKPPVLGRTRLRARQSQVAPYFFRGRRRPTQRSGWWHIAWDAIGTSGGREATRGLGHGIDPKKLPPELRPDGLNRAPTGALVFWTISWPYRRFPGRLDVGLGPRGGAWAAVRA
jgi:hypothetical protein